MGLTWIKRRRRRRRSLCEVERRQLLLFAAAALAWPSARAAGALLVHEHGHALAFSAHGKALLAPGPDGLAVYEEAAGWEVRDVAFGFSGFSVTERAIYASGSARNVPAGLLRSTDTGRTWQAIALAGEASFALIAAGYRSHLLYALTRERSSSLPSAGIYRSADEGRTWQRAAARALDGEIHGLAAHPVDPSTLAAATGAGLYLSSDGGEVFRRLDAGQAVTALTFDIDGRHIWYARPLASGLVQRALAMSSRRNSPLPPLGGDYVTCLAQSPADTAAMAFATRRRDVYLTRDGGREWRRIAGAGHGITSNEEEAE